MLISDMYLTPAQQAMSSQVKREAFDRFSITCTLVREILDEAANIIKYEHDIPDSDYAALDATMSRAFMRIRDEVTNPFRTEQMKLIAKQWERDVAQLRPCPGRPSTNSRMHTRRTSR